MSVPAMPVSAPQQATTKRLPAVDEVLRLEACQLAMARFGRPATLDAVRKTLAGLRARTFDHHGGESLAEISDAVAAHLEQSAMPILKRVFNLTGTVLHTNLGRALLPEIAIEAAIRAMRSPAALEFDLATGQRGERDDCIRGLICELTGAQDAIVVNNTAAAVLLVLNTLAGGKDVIVSRGELIEIGGSFRMPDVMARAGCRLIEVGTTNRTHPRDYEAAIGPLTAAVMKVHTSNYLIQGFTAEVAHAELAAIAIAKALPFIDDLGSGTLIDLSKYGLRRERTVQDAVRDGADLILFSGDKLLGGPQAGFIVGRKDLVKACAKNPMKRAMRLDKVRLAALEATLRLYRDPDRLAEVLPTLRMLTAPRDGLDALAQRLQPAVQGAVGEAFDVSVCDCTSQIGSGALPLETIASRGLKLAPANAKSSGRAIGAMTTALRGLAIPVIGRVADGAIILDVRTLDDEAAFTQQFKSSALRSVPP